MRYEFGNYLLARVVEHGESGGEGQLVQGFDMSCSCINVILGFLNEVLICVNGLHVCMCNSVRR